MPETPRAENAVLVHPQAVSHSRSVTAHSIRPTIELAMSSAQRQQIGCPDDAQMSLHRLRDLVTDEFALMDQEIKRQLKSHVPLVETICRHIINSGGKRLRPLTVLLTSRCLGDSGPAPSSLAVVIEFLHTATLLHDDVVDVSPTRRGRETAFSRWGGAASVLVGDVLFSRAFELMIELKSFQILEQLSRATTKISEGEVAQLAAVGDTRLSESSYLRVIEAKTASLFEVSASSAALLSCEDEGSQDAARGFGVNFGMAYQLIDDCLDYSGDPERMGKEPGNDLLEGKMTLPLIFTLANGELCDVRSVRDALEKRNASQFSFVAEAAKRSGGLDYTRRRAEQYSQLAIDYVMRLPDNAFRDALVSLVHFNLARQA